MKIMVLGATGMLGHKLVQGLSEEHEVYASVRSERRKKLLSRAVDNNVEIIIGIDAEVFDTVSKALDRVEPDVILNCIGIVKQSPESKDPVKSISINSLFPHLLAHYCSEKGAYLVCYSTDCVFSGVKGNYALSDLPDPVDIYGRSKLLGEVNQEGCITIRSSFIGPELSTKRGLVEWFISQEGKKVCGYRNAIFSGVSTLEMVKIISLIIEKHKRLNGILQVASYPISKYELLCLIREAARLKIEIEPDDQFNCDRSLDGSRFESMTGYRAPDWTSMVGSMLDDIEYRHYYRWSE